MQPFIIFGIARKGIILQQSFRFLDMQYKKVIFEVGDEAIAEMLIAKLSEVGYEGFEEAGAELFAYIPEEQYNTGKLSTIANSLGLDYKTDTILSQNWNALWESNFDPVVIDGLCTIRADFHNIVVATPFEIKINPKMSFGTGHHATTHLMMAGLKDLEPAGKSVLDFGTGTGVLAILAEMMGATAVTAIDNDEWAVTNALENVEANGCKNITVLQASLEDLPANSFDLILANINRNILLQYMDDLYGRLNNGGTILMSGLQDDDEQIIREAAGQAGFKYTSTAKRAGWIALRFRKN